MKNTCIFLMGATATGKTQLAIELIKHLPCEIISVDSAMIYRGMDIGTAKPSTNILAKAPHHLINICDPSESYSAAQFRHDALMLIEKIINAGRIPLLVGGTMLYFRALQFGLSELPTADEATRAKLLTEAQCDGWESLYTRLQQVDPIAASRIHAHDKQRIQRALEVYEITGQPITSLQQQNAQHAFPYSVISIALMPSDRQFLHERIAMRFMQMINAGFIDEVKQLFNREDLNKELPSMRSVGYRQVWEYLENKYDHETLCQRGIFATRQFAKRQLTWLRSWPDLHTFDCTNQNLINDVLQFIK